MLIKTTSVRLRLFDYKTPLGKLDVFRATMFCFFAAPKAPSFYFSLSLNIASEDIFDILPVPMQHQFQFFYHFYIKVYFYYSTEFMISSIFLSTSSIFFSIFCFLESIALTFLTNSSHTSFLPPLLSLHKAAGVISNLPISNRCINACYSI